MARPKISPGEKSLRQRFEETLIEMVQQEPLERISIGALSSKAGCSRSAFYYHYEDIYDLFDGILASCIPVEWIGTMADLLLSDKLDETTIQARAADLFTTSKPNIDRLCVLLGSKAGDRVKGLIKNEVMDIWAKALDRPAFEGDERMLFEFAFNGIFGVLAFSSSQGGSLDYHRLLSIAMPELPIALAACLEKCDSTASGTCASSLSSSSLPR